MTGRASIKGRGAAIFFGDASGKPEQARAVAAKPADDTTSVRPDVKTPRRQDAPTSVSASGSAPERTSEGSGDESRKFFEPLTLPDSLRRKLRGILRSERRIHTTIRFSAEEMAALRDLLYELETKQALRVARNEVMRLALHLLLEDYSIRRERSLLVQVLKEEHEGY